MLNEPLHPPHVSPLGLQRLVADPHLSPHLLDDAGLVGVDSPDQMPFVRHPRSARTRPYGSLLVRQTAQRLTDFIQRRHPGLQDQIAVSLNGTHRL
jgi:hypothetical protein